MRKKGLIAGAVQAGGGREKKKKGETEGKERGKEGGEVS